VLGGKTADLALDIKGGGNDNNYLEASYSLDGGPPVTIARRVGRINDGTTPETVTAKGLRGWTLEVRVKMETHGSDFYAFDNVTVTHHARPDWPAVPGFSDMPVTTDRLIEYTNNTPARTGFYRLKTKLE